MKQHSCKKNGNSNKEENDYKKTIKKGDMINAQNGKPINRKNHSSSRKKDKLSKSKISSSRSPPKATIVSAGSTPQKINFNREGRTFNQKKGSRKIASIHRKDEENGGANYVQ